MDIEKLDSIVDVIREYPNQFLLIEAHIGKFEYVKGSNSLARSRAERFSNNMLKVAIVWQEVALRDLATTSLQIIKSIHNVLELITVVIIDPTHPMRILKLDIRIKE